MITPSDVKRVADKFVNPGATPGLMESYRLGDTILWASEKKYHYNPCHANSTFVYSQVSRPYFGTIGQRVFNYVSRNKRLITLSEIYNWLSPEQETEGCFIHLRLGDKLVTPKNYDLDKVNTESPEWYVFDSIDKYEGWVTKNGSHTYECNSELYWKCLHVFAKRNNIKNITIVTGSHLTNCSVTYPTAYALLTVQKWFQERDITVNFQLGRHPDVDLGMLCSAEYLIGSAGVFGELAYNMNKSNNKFKNSTNLIDHVLGLHRDVVLKDNSKPPRYVKVLKNKPSRPNFKHVRK